MGLLSTISPEKTTLFVVLPSDGRSDGTPFGRGLRPLFDGKLALGTDESWKGMGVFDLFLPETPVHDVSDPEVLLEGVTQAEAHPADDTDGNGLFFDALFCADIALHEGSSFCLLQVERTVPFIFSMEGAKNQNSTLEDGRKSSSQR